MGLGRTAPTHVASIHVPLEALAQFSLDGLAFVDDSGHIATWNDAAASLSGVAVERALGAELSSIFLNAPKILSLHEQRPHAVRLTPVDDPHREIGAMYFPMGNGALLSFGPQRRFDAIERIKSEMLASISHELKTPIAVIKAYATTLRATRPETAHLRDEYLATIEEQADALHRAVEELLLASRADAHDLPMRCVSTPLENIVDAALDEIGASHSGRTFDRHDKVAVSGDPDLLREVFAQLLDNAVRFSCAPTPITINAKSDSSTTTVRIIDRGIGIAAEHLEYIFERFYRIEPNLTAAHAGTGLGLHIANAIVSAHGGKIVVESEAGRGTTFTVSLPVKS